MNGGRSDNLRSRTVLNINKLINEYKIQNRVICEEDAADAAGRGAEAGNGAINLSKRIKTHEY